MCKFKTISQNSFGCIVKCNSCDHLHIGFGNMLTVFSSSEFSMFQKLVQKIHDQQYGELLLTGDKVFINTGSDKVVIALNVDELKLLNELLTEGASMLQVDQLLFTSSENK